MNNREESDRIKHFLTVSIRVIAVLALAFFLLARDGIGPAYFDSIGKIIYWTGIVLFPLFSLNRDMLSSLSGQAVSIAIVSLHVLIVYRLYDHLQKISFITLTPICVVEFFVLAAPLLAIRKWRTGIWY